MSVQIGVLHSVYLSDRLKEAFTKGLKDSGWPEGTYTPLWPPENDGKYGHKSDGTLHRVLQDQVSDYVSNSVDLVVAAGGLVAALAAYEIIKPLGANGKPVVALIGRESSSGDTGYGEIHDNSVFKHVVFVDEPDAVLTRRDKLVAAFPASVTSATVGLMVNTNSKMWDGEARVWSNGGQTILLPYPDLAAKKENHHAHFRKFFEEAKRKNPTLSGIVLSSDPYFYRYRSKLMEAAIAKCDVKISFPLVNYKFKRDGSTHDDWSPTRHTIEGAKSMVERYQQLGVDAANVLNTLFPSQTSKTLL